MPGEKLSAGETTVGHPLLVELVLYGVRIWHGIDELDGVHTSIFEVDNALADEHAFMIADTTLSLVVIPVTQEVFLGFRGLAVVEHPPMDAVGRVVKHLDASTRKRRLPWSKVFG